MEKYISIINSPCVILAGAGTGKTRSIVEKTKYLITNKIFAPEKIVCLTFSNEAVKTIRERILPGLNGNEPIIKTFHSFCSDILKKYGSKIGLKDNFKIITPDDGKIILHKYQKLKPILCNRYISEINEAKELGLNEEIQRTKIKSTNENLEQLENKLREIDFKINTNHIKKNNIEELKNEKEKLEEEIKQKKFIKSWIFYEKIKLIKNYLDYTDLQIKTLELFNKFPEISREFDYLIVDEFQDTNKIQCELISKISPSGKVTIVGDLNQSIYKFRGAYKDNFEYIKKIYGINKENIFFLDKSHRSTNNILSVSHKLIEKNYKNKEECFKIENAYGLEGEKIKVFELKNSKEEIRKIIEIIREEISKCKKKEEICVIFRTHIQANALKKQLEIEGINYSNVGRDSILSKGIIKKICAFMTIISKYNEESAFGVESAWWEIAKESKFEKEELSKLGKRLKEISKEKDFHKKLIDSGIDGLDNKISEKINYISKIIKEIIALEKKETPQLVEEIYKKINLEKEEENKLEIEILERFKEFVKDFSDSESKELNDFLYHLTTIKALDINIDLPEREKEGVKIMTGHSTKGLEYEVVIIGSMVDKKFPIDKTDNKIIQINENTESNIEEERRLAYVSFTRAKSRLYLTYAKEYGKKNFEKSQFLKEIELENNPSIEFFIDLNETNEKKEEQIIDTEEKEEFVFSPSSLNLFLDCQKKYEFKYIYNMPEEQPDSWESILLGTFVHKILERGVSANVKDLDEFINIAKILQMDEFKEVNFEDAINQVKTFFERNKDKYDEKSRTEVPLYAKINGIKFRGFADRIDFTKNNEVTIIDYKTGKTDINPKARNFQIGFYAIASKKLGIPKKLVLDMLAKEKPTEFVLDENGIAKEINSKRISFSLEEIKNEMYETALKIINATKTEFKFCIPEKNCEFCSKLS